MKKVNADEVSSGDLFGNRDFLNGNYLYRYVGAKLGLYGNSKQDALYFGYFVDANHQPLDALKLAYELHFAKGDLPPNKAFWSLTMYDGKTQLLVSSPIDATCLTPPPFSLTSTVPMVRLPSTFRRTRPARIRNRTGYPRQTVRFMPSSASTCREKPFSTAPGRSRRCRLSQEPGFNANYYAAAGIKQGSEVLRFGYPEVVRAQYWASLP
jgi:Protein of unknown function (DUF1214)